MNSRVFCIFFLGLALPLKAQPAYNDQGAGTRGPGGQTGTQTGMNVNTFGLGASTNSGHLIDTHGQQMPETLTIRAIGNVTTANASGTPNPGTPLANNFDRFVWFGPSAAGEAPSSILISPGGKVSYTFSNLYASPYIQYIISAGAVGAPDDPLANNRWTLIDIQGARCVQPYHYQGSNSPWGYLDAARVPLPGGPTNNQVAMLFGNNVWGDMVRYSGVIPGDNGTITITCAPYTGPVPAGWGSTNVAGMPSSDSYAYGLTGIFLSVLAVDYFPVRISPATVQVETCSTVTFNTYPFYTGQFQWYRNHVAISNATNSTLVITNVQPGVDAGLYSVTASYCGYCDYCFTNTATASLSVLPTTNAAILIRAVSSNDLRTVIATFSSPVTISSPTGADFLARPSSGPEIAFTKAVVTNDTNVVLTTAEPLQQKNYDLVIQGNGVQHRCATDIVTNSSRIIQNIFLIRVGDQTLWHYWNNGTDPGPGWLGNDLSSWPTGMAVFDGMLTSNRTFITDTYYGPPLILPVRTHLEVTNSLYHEGTNFLPTAYFRTRFNLPTDPTQCQLTLKTWRQGGAVVYINGQEGFRYNVTNALDGTLPFDLYCKLITCGLQHEKSTVPSTMLVSGTNDLAVMLKNGRAALDCSAWTMAVSLEATVTNFVEVSARLAVSQNPDESLTISWSPTGGILQESPTLNPGNWQNSSNQANPQTRTGSNGNLFFRVLRP